MTDKLPAILERTEQQLAARKSIDFLEYHMRQAVENGDAEAPLTDCHEDNSEADHYFGEGVYARGLWIPAGTAVVGKLHKFDRIVIIAAGKCKFVDEFHEEYVQAPYVGEFKAGSKTAVFAIEDTYWIACHKAVERDTNAVMADLIVSNHDEYTKFITEVEK